MSLPSRTWAHTMLSRLLRNHLMTWSMAKSGARPIGDKLAQQIEHRCAVPRGWLDEAREPEGTTSGEEQFLELALRVYRSTNAAGRKRLRQLLKSWDEPTPPA